MEYTLTDVLRLTENFRTETHFMLGLQQYRRAFYPDQLLEYCLPWYNNELIDYSLGYADVYLAGMMDDLDENMSFLWSGSSFYTVKTDAADIFRYNSLLKNPPVLMDNSLLTVSKNAYYGGSVPYFPHKLRLYNFFEPYTNAELNSYKDLINKNRVFINQAVHSGLEKIKILTALDFYWNMEAYDMDIALWKILVSRYGHSVAKELILYGDALAGMLEINLRMQQKDQVHKNYRTGISTLLVMNEHLNIIAAGLGSDSPLVAELTALYGENKKNLETLYREYMP